MIIIRKADRANYIIDGVADFYGVTVEQLKRRTRKRMNRKRIAMHMLYDIADLSLKDIACYMDYRVLSLPAVYQHISILRDLLESSKECRTEYDEILAHLKLN
jgi:chromosomal replication initiation ATPase DnaA